MTYYKIINDRQVFSQCKSIYDEQADAWISNPTAEQIASSGWLPYTPPIVPPQPAMEPDQSETLEAIKRMLSTETEALSDEDALAVAALYPTWASKIDTEVAAGERLWYDGKLYKVIQGHTVSALWVPDHNPALFAEVSIEEWPPIPEVITAENAYMTGDRGTWKGNHYICKMDNCVWNPDQLPSAWEMVA